MGMRPATCIVCGLLLAVALACAMWAWRRRAAPSGAAAAPPARSAARPPPAPASGIPALLAALPLRKMDTIQNLMQWRGEMSRLDRILEDVGAGAAAAAAQAPAATDRSPVPRLTPEPLLTPEEERLIAAAMRARQPAPPP